MEAILQQSDTSVSAGNNIEDHSLSAVLPAPKTKILYGVQGTGNGHISRASAMQKAFSDNGHYDVTWVMSGRAQEKIMCCEQYHWYRGMTFATRNGKVEILKTLTNNNVFQFLKDVREVDFDDYALIITDFEPVIAWAAQKQRRETLGIGHQYAFCYPMPMAGRNQFSELAMKYFAPATQKIGLHWHHFDQPVLPPIVDLHGVNPEQDTIVEKVLVYLPFENQDELIQLLRTLPAWKFYVYSAEMEDFTAGNVHTRAISKTGFKNDLITASAIITNSGFELISECLSLGKRILSKPLHGQIEQLSNAKALQELGYATVIKKITAVAIERWLNNSEASYKVEYPDVARAIVAWIEKGHDAGIEELSRQLWRETTVSRIRQ